MNLELAKFETKMCLRNCSEKLRGAFLSFPVDDKIFVYGNQKSGTSAIANLLAVSSQRSVQVDFVGAWFPRFCYRDGMSQKEVRNFISSNKYPFSKDVVKEPNLTLLLPQIIAQFPKSKHIFIVRNPLSNIVSILSRVGLKPQGLVGDSNNLSLAWRHILSGAEVGGSDQSPVCINLAKRWLVMADMLLQNSDGVFVMKYEDFILDKEGSIKGLMRDLGIAVVREISDIKNVQFQPRGIKVTNYFEYFGSENIGQIKDICGEAYLKLYGCEMAV